MKDKNFKKFRDNFYKFSTFYAGNDQDFLSLKQSWVINKIVSKRKSWNINSLTRFIESLPHEYDFFEGDFFKFCLLALKGTFIKSSFLQIQDNASIEMHTARDTQNSSSNLCDYYINLRFEEMFNDMPLLPKLSGFAVHPYKNNFRKWAIKADVAKEKHRAFFLEDRDFLFSLICFFGMLRPEKKEYYYKIACLDDDDFNCPDIEKGKEILIKSFLDGTETKYINKVNKLIKKELAAISLLPGKKISDIYMNISLYESLDRWRSAFYACNNNFLQYKDISFPKTNSLNHDFQNKTLDFTKINIGDSIYVNNMMGAYKIIQSYSDYFSDADLDFLAHKKEYLGEQSKITCIKSFNLLDKDRKKDYLPQDLNTEIFKKKLESERLGIDYDIF